MKKIIIKIFIYGFTILLIWLMGVEIRQLRTDLSNATTNIKAYAAENDELKKSHITFQVERKSLELYNDSLTRKMREIANENKIKDKKINALQYQLEHFFKKDTIFIRDTIFKEPDFVLDTCIIDQWNKSCLHLAYPGVIAISNEYNNEKYITLHSHKEPIKPRKWFLPRWFTRKHTIVEVLIVDKNPYVTTPKQRYIEIIDK